MGIYQGTNGCDDFKNSTTQLKSIYSGSNLVWEGSIANSFQPTLLWTNSSPNSAFSSSSISINYSAYTHLLIFCKALTSSDGSFTSSTVAGQLIWTGNPSYKMIASVNTMSGSTFYQYSRTIQVTSAKTSLSISSTGYYGWANTSASGSYTTGTSYCIPLRIYGVNQNTHGKFRSLYPSYTGAGLILSGESSGSVTLRKHYKYLLVDYQTRTEQYDHFNFSTNWFALNSTSDTRGSARFGTTSLTSSELSIIPENTSSRWIAGGHRYESSMDLWRTNTISYSGTTVSIGGTPWVFSCTGPYGNQQGGSNSGIRTIWGINKALW